MKGKVLISGGSGLVGSRLTELLLQQGYEVSILSRTKSESSKVSHLVWNVEKGEINPHELEDIDYVIHLAGAGIVDKPWTAERKEVILSSRVDSTLLLKKAFEQVKNKPKAIVSASAIGYYGIHTSEKIYQEQDKPGSDFLADTCIKWEESIDDLVKLGIPTSRVRIGLVLSAKGGALYEMARPVKLGFGAALGNGKQYMPWIHIDDLCGLIQHCFENKLAETFNGAAPNPVNNKQFMQVLAKTLKRPIWLPNVPAFVLKLILGNRAQLVLEGSRVSAEKTENSGFVFQFRELKAALRSIYC